MRAVRLPAVPVNHECVVGDLEPVTLGDGMLAPLDIVIHELLDVSAIDTLDVVVVRTLVELEDCHAVGEVVTRHETGSLKLGQHAINGRETDILARIDEASVNVFG